MKRKKDGMEHPPMERRDTVRQEMVSVLERFGPMSARELSAEISIPERDVPEHLEHISRSLEKAGRRLVVEPAQCRKCGFVFEDRKRLTKPGKCPRCKATAIEEPLFSVSR